MPAIRFLSRLPRGTFLYRVAYHINSFTAPLSRIVCHRVLLSRPPANLGKDEEGGEGGAESLSLAWPRRETASVALSAQPSHNGHLALCWGRHLPRLAALLPLADQYQAPHAVGSQPPNRCLQRSATAFALSLFSATSPDRATVVTDGPHLAWQVPDLVELCCDAMLDSLCPATVLAWLSISFRAPSRQAPCACGSSH